MTIKGFKKSEFVGPRIAPVLLKWRMGGKFHLDNIGKAKSDNRLKKWSLSVKARDGKNCMQCGGNERLHSHHLKAKSEYPELMYDLDNGITLCASCHSIVHGGSIA